MQKEYEAEVAARVAAKLTGEFYAGQRVRFVDSLPTSGHWVYVSPFLSSRVESIVKWPANGNRMHVSNTSIEPAL